MKRKSLFNKLITSRFAIKVVLLFISMTFVAIDIMAQGPDSGGPDGEPGGDPDLVPVDGGLGFLLAAGVGYGVKKAREYQKKKV